MIEMYTWISVNWGDLVQIITMTIGIASIIVKFTPTLRDDNALKAVIRFVGRYIALNR
jgi:hypothetical protein